MSSASISSEGSSLKTAATYIYDRLITRRFDPARRALADSTNRAATPELSASGLSEAERRLWEEVKNTQWYHSIRLSPLITTPGQFDHVPYLEYYPVPASLHDKRVLEVAAYDGFWSFLMEQRGAVESFAIDIPCMGDLDMPPLLRASLDRSLLETPTGAGFRLAQRVLNSKVNRVPMSVYDLDERAFGQFDFVFMSDVLVHIMNPVKAVQAVRKVTRGEAVFVETFNPLLPGTTVRYKGFPRAEMIWWSYSLGALRNIIVDAGFSDVKLFSRFRVGKRGEKPWNWHAAFVAKP